MRNPIIIRHRRQELHAGSMADIAFLLLIFFLVTTTMDREEGLPRLLAQPAELPPAPVHPRNVLHVQVNAAGELLLNGKPDDLAGLRSSALEFLSGPADRQDLPQRLDITEAACLQRMASLGDGPERTLWQQRLETVRQIGPYQELPASAHMTVQAAGNTPYAAYIAVQDELEAAVYQLRNAIALRRWNREYRALDELDPQDRRRMEAIRRAVPLRIGDGELAPH